MKTTADGAKGTATKEASPTSSSAYAWSTAFRSPMKSPACTPEAKSLTRAPNEATLARLDLAGRTFQMLGSMSKYSSSSFLPPSPLPSVFSVSTNSMRSIHFTIL